jgi:glyoxylase-like metal-dependent hydrolase (beta-lactamase superfamily II)
MLQLLHPDLPYASDMDPDEARATRQRILREVLDRGTTLAISHLGTPFHTLL